MRANPPTKAIYIAGVDMVSNFNNYQELVFKSAEDIVGCSSSGNLKIIAGEYASYDEYKKILGNNAKVETENDWGGAWLKSDRISRNTRWKGAMDKILENKWKGILKPFYQVSDFYLYIQWKAENLGHEVQWAKGAAYLVDDLGDGYEGDVLSGNASTGNVFPSGERMGQSILSDLNLGILDLAIDRWSDLFYGSGKGTQKKGMEAYEWDKEFIKLEQVGVAFTVYPKYQGTRELTDLKEITRKEGLFGKGSLAIARFIPDFTLIGVDVSNSIGRYGEFGRYHVPMFMLYPSIHSIDANLNLIHYEGGVTLPNEIKTCLTNSTYGKLKLPVVTTTNPTTGTPNFIYDCLFIRECYEANSKINMFYNTIISTF